MYKRLSSLLALACLLAGCSNNQVPLGAARQVQSLRTPQQASGSVRSNAGLDAVAKRMRTVMFNRLDVNGDGLVHRPEASFFPPEGYSAVDANRDGIWQLNEFLRFNFDASSTVVPSRALLRAGAQRAWGYFDTDSNGLITLDEVLAAMTPQAPPGLPAPDPGTIAAAQLRAKTLFAQADRNLDHKLNASEFEDVMALGALLAAEEPPLAAPLTPHPDL